MVVKIEELFHSYNYWCVGIDMVLLDQQTEHFKLSIFCSEVNRLETTLT